MGTSITHTKSATWLVAPPDSGDDIGEVVAGYLDAIGSGRAPALVRELVGRTVEAARRALATGADLGAALVAAVLDAVGAAAAGPPTPATDPTPSSMTAGLRSHLEAGAAASASPEVAAGWIPRIVGSAEGLVEQCGDDADHVAMLAATMALIDIGGGLEDRFGCALHGRGLVAAIEAAAGDTVSRHALVAMQSLVDANATFDTAVESAAAGDAHEAIDGLGHARSLFLAAGLSVEASVTLVEQAHVESELFETPDSALDHYAGARSVLVEFGRDIEVARADRDLALAVASAHGTATAASLVDDAAAVFDRYGLAQDLVLCDVTRACLARDGTLPHATGHYLDRAADRLAALGRPERAARVRAVADREQP